MGNLKGKKQIGLVLVLALLISISLYATWVYALNKVTNYDFNGSATGWTSVNTGTGLDGCGVTTVSTRTAMATFAYNNALSGHNCWNAVSGATSNTRYKGYIYQTVSIPGSGTVKAKGKFDYYNNAGTWNTNADSFIRLDLFDSTNTTYVASLGCVAPTANNGWTSLAFSSDVNLTGGTNYTLRVTFSYRVTSSSAATLAVDNIIVTAAPTGLTSPSQTSTTIDLSWTASTTPSGPALSGYNVYRSATTGGPYTKINGSLIVGTTYTDSGPLTPGTTYYYVITDVDANSNESPYSAELAQATLSASDQVNVNNGSDPGAYTVYANDTNKVADSFTMATDANTATVTAVTASLSNSANVSGIRLYKDNGVVGTYEPGTDTLLATGTPGATVTFSGLTENLTISATNYLIMVDIASGATPGQTVVATVTGLTVTAPDVQGTITDSGTTLTIGALLTVADGANRRAASTLCPNQDHVIDQFKLTASSGTISVTSITIQGNANVSGNITGVKLYRDTNGNGLLDGGEPQVGTTQTIWAPSPPNYTVTFSPLSESITTTGTNYLVVYTVAAVPTDGAVVTSRVTTVVAAGANVNNIANVSNDMILKRYPSLITNFTANCGATSASLSWNNPSNNPPYVDNLAEVKVLRKTGGYPTGPSDAGATQVYDNLAPTPGGAVGVNDSPLLTGTTYYWAVYSKDSCGNWNTATTAGSNAANCTPSASNTLTVTNPAHPAAASVAQASTNNVIDRLRFTASAGTITVTSVKVKLVDGVGPTPIQPSDIASVQLYTDEFGGTPNGLITGETFLGSGAYNSGDGTYTISGLNFAVTSTSRDMLIVFNISSSSVVGRKFRSQVNSGYVTVASPDTVNVFASITSNIFTIIAGGGATGSAFTVSIINPRDGGAVSGSFKIQVQIYNPGGLSGLTATLSTDGGSTYPNTLTQNANYSPGANSGIYEYTWNNPTPGSYTLKAQATNTVPQTGTSRSITVTVRPPAASDPTHAGDGNLLARDNSSQLCLDCHALQTHSSQYSTQGYGNWAMVCVDCHQPHETTNIYLVRQKVPTPNSGTADVTLYNLTNLTSGTGTGLCEVCHTQTSYYKNASSVPGANGHDSGNCTSCHVHASGFKKLFCNDCHQAPPNPGNDRHPLHYNSATLPTSYTNAVNGSTSSAYIFPCAKCHSGTHLQRLQAGTLADPYVVEVNGKFDNTTDPKNPGGTYTADVVKFTDLSNTKYYQYSNGTCNSVYCHSNATPLTPVSRGGNAIVYAAPKWMDTVTGSCTICHKGADTYASMQYPGNVSALSDAHWMHVATDRYGQGAPPRIGCVKCHNATVSNNTTISDKSKHVDGQKEVVFDTTGTWISPNCSTNVYCHSDGQASPTYRTVAWNTAGPLACDACHNGNASNTNKMSSGKHTQHINNASGLGTNYLCYQCHANTTNNSADTISTSGYQTYHVNGAPNVNFNTALNPSAGWGGTTCTNVYCHSSGQATPTYRTVPNWVGGGALDCKGCHGADAAFTSQWGESNFANGGVNLNNSNSHQKHVGPSTSTGVANCGWCHPATANNNGAIVASSTTHTDGSRQVAQPASGPTFTYAAGKTCNSISCHNSGNAQWGQTTSLPTCLSCHGTTGADSKEGTGLVAANFWKNGTVAKINTTEWGYGGHGKTAGTYDSTTNPAANFPTAGGDADGSSRCYYCHLTSVTHYNDSNPFRLANYGATGDGWNSTCLICHKSTGGGYNPGQGAKNATIFVTDGVTGSGAHHGTKHDVTTKGGWFCWDCHDPHGERPSATNSSGNNVAMIGRQVMKQQDGTYGYLGASGVAVNVQLYDVVTAGQAVGRLTEATNTPRQGICQACHDSSEVLSNNMTKYWRNDGTDLGPVTSAHNAAIICTQCHKHNAEFRGAGACMDCHNAPITKTKTDGPGTTIRRIVSSGAPYTTGTAAFAANSTTVTGTGTTWTSAMVGSYIKNNTNGAWYLITAFTDATHLTISPAAVANVSASAYTIDNGDFTVSNAGHMVNGTKATGYASGATSTFALSRGAQIVTNWDCIVCHAEGDSTSSGTNINATSEHNDAAGHIALRNVDNPGNPGTDGTNFWNVNNVTWNSFSGAGNTDYDRLDKFCMGCHDSDGASGITVNSTLPNGTGLDVGASRPRRLTPFNPSDPLRNAYDRWSDNTADYVTGTATFTSGSRTVTGSGTSWYNSAVSGFIKNNANGVWYEITNVNTNGTSLTIRPAAAANASGAYTITRRRPRVTDAKTAFTTTNYSHHAVLGARYSSKQTTNPGWFNTGANAGIAWTTMPLKNGQVQGGASGVGETAVLHCSDCHLSSVNAHGATKSWYMLDNSGDTYITGTATFTNGSTTVTGSGTTWTTTFVGRLIKNNADGVGYLITAVASGTSLTISPAYAGATVSGAAYTIYSSDRAPIWGSGTGASNTSNYVCFNCHAKGVYADVDNNSVSRKGHHMENSSPFGESDNSFFGTACLLCHGGGGFGNIHGVNETYKGEGDTDTQPHLSYRFFPGGYMMWDPSTGTTGGTNAEWQTGAVTNAGCYFQSNTWSNCGRGDGQDDGTNRTTNYSRNTNY